MCQRRSASSSPATAAGLSHRSSLPPLYTSSRSSWSRVWNCFAHRRRSLHPFYLPGSGKTAAFLLPTLERLLHSPGVRARKVCPFSRVLGISSGTFAGKEILCLGRVGDGTEPPFVRLFSHTCSSVSRRILEKKRSMSSRRELSRCKSRLFLRDPVQGSLAHRHKYTCRRRVLCVCIAWHANQKLERGVRTNIGESSTAGDSSSGRVRRTRSCQEALSLSRQYSLTCIPSYLRSSQFYLPNRVM